jgi:hypothetical protein
MTSRLSKLVLATVLAGSVPAAAAAFDPYGRQVAAARPAPWQPAPAPPREWRDGGRHDGGWRAAAWRERELASVRADLRALEAQRAEFHARNAWRPGKLRRFDRWYAERRAELERRWHELQLVAWR